IIGIFSCRKSSGHQAGRNHECQALSLAGSQLWPASRIRDVRVFNGQWMTREEYHFFLHQNLKQHCIMGNDYYVTNEHRVSPDGAVYPAGEVFGYDEITREYYDRYLLPVMHTETNFNEGPNGNEAVYWLWKEWANVLRVRNSGVPIVGFTWHSITDQMDWDTALREAKGQVNPLGLFDLNRKMRPVGKAY